MSYHINNIHIICSHKSSYYKYKDGVMICISVIQVIIVHLDLKVFRLFLKALIKNLLNFISIVLSSLDINQINLSFFVKSIKFLLSIET